MRFRFGDFELDLETYQLARSGLPVEVEPRVLDLLAYLVRARGRVVSKNELVERVWSEEAVSDAALTRAVHRARRALGDSATEPRWIETVHGRGYRFLGEAHVGGAQDAPERTGSLFGPPAPALRSRVRTVGVALVGALALLAVVLVARHRAGPERPAGPSPVPSAADRRPAQPMPTIALHGFTAPEDDPELQLLGLSLLDLLGSRLQAVGRLAVRDPAGAARESGAAEIPAAFGNRLGARYVLRGELERGPEAGDARVDLTLHEVLDEGRSLSTPLGRYGLPSLETAADLDRYLSVRDHVSSRVLELLLPALEGSSAGEAVTPRDPEAYRYYLLGYSLLLDDFCSGGAAEALLERSVGLDPGFAPAWLYLGAARYNQVWACGGDAAHYDTALDAFDRAAAVDPGSFVPRIHRIALLVETGRIEEAYEAILAEERRHPRAPAVLNAKLYALRYGGYLEASLEALEELRSLDPLVFTKGAIGGSPATYLYLGRQDDFLAELPPLDMPYFAYFRGFVALVRGDAEGALRAVGPALSASPGGIFGQLCHAVAALAEGDPAAARAVVEAVSRHRRELGHGDGEITYKQAQLLALAGARERAVEELGRAVEEGFFCPRCFETDPSLAALSEDAGFERVLDRARDRHREFGLRFGLPRDAP